MEKETKCCPYCGETILAAAKKCKHCGEWLEEPPARIQTQEQLVNKTVDRTDYRERAIINKISDCQKASNILWLIIAIFQILSIVCIIAGIWNIIGTIATWQLPKKILNRDYDVPSYYEGIAGLIVMAIINFFLGGFIGVILIGFDFYIRNLVMENRHLFEDK